MFQKRRTIAFISFILIIFDVIPCTQFSIDSI